ncbi:hypothetical protein ACQ4LE_011041 [Meloidogyne hapla]|uniref:Coiled-coil domain-containing protein 134 n=1 Tax=Meloidogyne hapla TaxID=6305 RepID=A0A1I8B184_MELHA
MIALLYYFAVILVYCHAEVSHSNKNDFDKSTPVTSSNKKEELNVDSFQKEYPLLLKIKKREQDAALKTILTKNKDEKQLMLRQLFTRIYETIKESKQLLLKYNENIDDFKLFSSTEESREHFARIIENTIFLAGLTLYFPKFALYYVNKDVDFHQIYQWSNNFCSNLTFLDNETKELLNLAAQEIELIPKSEDFVNPYKDFSMITEKEEMQREALKEMKEREMAKKMAKSNKPKKKKNKSDDSFTKSEL